MIYLAYVATGLFIGLFLQSTRRKMLHLSGLWAGFAGMALLAVSEASTAWQLFPLLVIPRFISAYSTYFFDLPAKLRRELVNAIPIFLIGLLVILEVSSSPYIIGIYVIWELVGLTVKLRSVYRRRGISTVSRPGKRILLINTLVLSLLILLITTLFLPSLTLLWLGVLAIYGTWQFAEGAAFERFSQSKYAKSDLQPEEKAVLINRLEEVIREEAFLLQGNASLASLAQRLKTSSHHLSQLLNETRQQTFFGLLASVRVSAAKRLLTDPKHQHEKIEEIASLVGYASKSAFNTSFKRITGKTPSEFRSAGVRPDKIERPHDREKPRTDHYADTFGLSIITSVMFSNFLKVYFRSLQRNKVFAIINLFGLTMGIGSCMLIFLYLNHELSFDRFHDRADDIHRIVWMTGNPQTRTPHPMAQAMVTDFSEVEAGVSITPIYGPGLSLQSLYIRNTEKDRLFREPDVFFADSTFFDVFDFELVAGNREEVLRNVGDMVITESMAKKYFDDENPVGKVLEMVEYNFRGEVVGVMEDAPATSHFHPRILISYMTPKSNNPDSFWWTWGDFGHFNYIKLRPGTDATELEAAIPEWLITHLTLSEDQVEELRERRSYAALQPIVDIHLHSKLRWELESNSNIIFIRILWAAVVFLIVIACVNFVNLSSARAFERVKEVGIRRTLGGEKITVLSQFVLESITTSVIALVFGYLLAMLTFEYFLTLTGKEIAFGALFAPDILALSTCTALIIGIVSGLYPALTVLPIKPVDTLKGKFINQKRGSGIRRGLIALQFIASAIMIFGSLMVLYQIRFMEDKELGFDEDQTIIYELHSRPEVEKIELIKNEIRGISGVIGVGGISNIPAGQFNQNVIYSESDQTNRVDCSELRVDYDALQVLGITLKAGRWFERGSAQDSLGASFIVNEAAAAQLNVEDLFSEPIYWDEEVGPRKGRIVGVIQDFHYKSLHRDIQPIVINVLPGAMNYLMIKVQAGANMSAVIAALGDIHAQFDKDLAMDYSFLDNLVGDQYEAEKRALGVFNLFTVLALILAGMGLLGLAHLVITQRTREIGIRKVVGARILDIVIMENKTFLKVVGLALLIGLPTGYLLMEQWLQGFAYRIPFQVSPFLLTATLLAILAVLSVSMAVLRTVLINPSQALRYE